MGIEQDIAAELPLLRRRALRLCHNSIDAEDLAQDAVVKALNGKASFQPGTNLRAWLMTILRNEFLTQRRRAGRIVEDPDDFLTTRLASQSDTQAALEAKDAIAHLALMSEEHVRVLMAAASGMTIESMAERENIPEGTVKSRVSRARARFAELLGENIEITSDVAVA